MDTRCFTDIVVVMSASTFSVLVCTASPLMVAMGIRSVTSDWFLSTSPIGECTGQMYTQSAQRRPSSKIDSRITFNLQVLISCLLEQLYNVGVAPYHRMIHWSLLIVVQHREICATVEKCLNQVLMACPHSIVQSSPFKISRVSHIDVNAAQRNILFRNKLQCTSSNLN